MSTTGLSGLLDPAGSARSVAQTKKRKFCAIPLTAVVQCATLYDMRAKKAAQQTADNRLQLRVPNPAIIAWMRDVQEQRRKAYPGTDITLSDVAREIIYTAFRQKGCTHDNPARRTR